MTPEELMKGFQDMQAMLLDINKAVSAKSLPILGPIETVFRDILSLVQDTHAKVLAQNTPQDPPLL